MTKTEEDRPPAEREVRREATAPTPMALEGRHIIRLDASRPVLLVTAGVVDIFAQPAEAARTHLFRVKTGEVILGLTRGLDEAGQADLIAVGGQGSEILAMERAHLSDVGLLDRWVERLVEEVPGPGSQETPDGWPAAATADSSSIEGTWESIDRVHDWALGALARRLRRESADQVARLQWRAAKARSEADDALGELARIVNPPTRLASAQVAGDPLLDACRAAGEVLGATMIRPAGRRSAGEDFEAVAEIARASRLRVRRTVLRAGWWRRSTGPLVAWQGEARRPVAIVPVSSRRYALIEAESGARHLLDEALAQTLSSEAATFYQPFPEGPLPARRLLAWAIGQGGPDARRILLTGMALALVAFASPLVVSALVDSAIPAADMSELAFCAGGLVLVAISIGAFQAVQGIATVRLASTLHWKLQAAVMDRLLRLPTGFFKRYAAGDLADRVLAVDRIGELLTGRAIAGLLAGVFCVFGIGLMVILDPPLAVLAVGLTLLHGAVSVLAPIVRLGHERRYFALQGKASGQVLQFLAGVGKLRAAAATHRALALWAGTFSLQKRHFIRSQRIANRLVAFEAGFPIFAALVIFALAMRRGAGAVDPGRFLAFFVAFGQSMAAMASLGAAIGQAVIAAPFFDRLAPVLECRPEVAGAGEDPGEISGAIELNQVTFGYGGARSPLFDRLSVHIAAGEYVALVGPSGCGKSTVLRLILGFEQAQSGTILFDGRSIERLNVEALRRQIGIVLQDGRLKSGTIYDNICGSLPVPIERAWEAARQAGLEVDIEAMPMGMHTLVTEGMSTLSGGQRQRLMIASALVHRPRILLLDESTSALDNRTQAIVRETVARLDVTRIVIAHRLSTVRDARRIIVLADGGVAQSGTFEELIDGPGLFAELAKRQLA
ncbi:MAG TPA: NHLP bacteriocin export ABC transporter permease/ATPase subunit [Caulobacteraceae bacterium]|jgi:NHLM bacteriocin system ABC transporter ATP-binding protein